MAEAFTITNASYKTQWTQYFYEAKEILRLNISMPAANQEVSTEIGNVNYGIFQVIGSSFHPYEFNSSITLPAIISSGMQRSQLSMYLSTGGVTTINNFYFYMDDTHLFTVAGYTDFTLSCVVYVID